MGDAAVTILGNAVSRSGTPTRSSVFQGQALCLAQSALRSPIRITQGLKVWPLEPYPPGCCLACSTFLALGSWMRCALKITVVKCRIFLIVWLQGMPGSGPGTYTWKLATMQERGRGGEGRAPQWFPSPALVSDLPNLFSLVVNQWAVPGCTPSCHGN